ncbi:transglycosylase SLT domain-containing protein [Actinomycetospora sp. OC33-EN08]|uniref:Transglycosylase SLT domain-containing protein n=1 Tax=Actinomycetospora aurantiaca TaxID=3129233 RepID=A0ABU8MQY1_9PSEU
MPSRATVWNPPAAPARPRPARGLSTATSGKILVAAVAAGAVVPAVQTLDTSHTADADPGTTQLDATQMALAAQHGPTARPAASATTAISDVTTVGMSAADLDAAAKASDTGADDLQKAISVARENGPVEFGRPYSAGNEETLNGQISKALGLLGLPQKLAPGVKKIIMRESTGNPDAINNWDSNAAAGTPSKGLMQLIDTTFRNAVLPSLADKGIYDPVANITAGIRTMVANHGLDAVTDGGLKNSSGNYIGYGGAKLPSDGLGRAD